MTQFWVGQKINNLTIVKIEKANYGNKWITFMCDCKTVIKLQSSSVKNRIKKNSLIDCGCQNPNRIQRGKRELIGRRFGKLLVIEYDGQDKIYQNMWKCQCDCGNITRVSRSNLKGDKKGAVNSCGKCKNSKSHKFKGYKEIPLGFWNNLKRQAIERNLEFSISIQEIWNLFIQQNKRCALTGRPLFWFPERTASIDRKNSKLGYFIDNVQIIHKHINIMKNNYDQDYFIKSCSEIFFNKKEYLFTSDIPDWTEYFLGIAKTISSRSKDCQTKVGCVITDNKHHIISTGYNSFPRGLLDNNLPNFRPEKYPYMLHAEQSAIASMSVSPHSISDGCNMYVTMRPCLECLKLIINSNIKKIYAIDVECSEETKKNEDIFNLLLYQSKIEYFLLKPNLFYLYKVFE